MNLSHLLLGALATGVLSLQLGASAPTIVEAAAKGNPNGFNLTFSEPVDPATATNPANYRVDGGVSVTGASLLYGTNEATIVVHTTDLTGTGPFTVTVNGVTDQEQPANEVAPNSTALIRRAGLGVLERSFGLINGGAGIGGTTLADLYAAFGRFPDQPDLIQMRPELSIIPFRTNSYGSQLIGYLEPPETGDYRFHITAQNQAILFLSSDASAANKRPIAGEPIRGERLDYLSPGGSPRTYNSADTGLRNWIATNFPNRANDDAMVNDSLSAVGPIHLEAGKRYYIEALVKCGFYDMLDIAWQRPGDAAVTNRQPAIEGSYLAPALRPTDGPVSVPWIGDNFAVDEGGRYILYSQVVGTMPYQYQWFRNTTPIPEATNAMLNLPFVNMNDHGAEYRLRVRNAFSEALSDSAVLQIIPDTEPPTVDRAEGSHQFDRVVLTFSEPLDTVTATDTNNYSITIAGTQTVLNILEAGLRHIETPHPRGRTQVVLRTAPQSPGIRYRVAMANLTDRSALPHGLAEQPTNIEFTAWVLSPGFLHREVFPLASADQLDTFDFDALTNVPAPSGFLPRYVTSAEDTLGLAGLARLSGQLVPTLDGNHILGIYSLRSSRFYLDTNGVAGPFSLVASREGSGFPRAWNFQAGGPQISAPVALTASTGYRFELRHAPTSSSVQAGVTWQAPGEAAPANDTPSRLTGSLIACYANPDAPVFQYFNQPQSQTVDEFGPVSFSAFATATEWGEAHLPLRYQWQRNGSDINGATNATYTIPTTLVSAAGTYRCVFIVPGRILPSDEATLTVIPHPLPEPDVAYALADRRKVIVRFTSRIGSEMASTPGVFTIPGLSIESVSVRPDLESVELATSLQTAGQVYAVNIHAIFDFDGTPVEMPVAPVQLNFTGPVLTAGYVLRETYTNILGTTIGELTNHVSFPLQPARRDYLSGIDYSASPPVTNAGVRISGWITPPADGDYDFYIAGDFQSLLYLSTDENPANKMPVAMEPEWNNYRDFAANDRRINITAGLHYFPWAANLPVNRTPNTVGPRALQASKRYYFEVLKKKQSGGPDHVSVAMVPAGSPIPGAAAVVSGAAISSYLSPDNRITITQQPTNRVAHAASGVTGFNVIAKPLVTGPLSYRWFRDGVALAHSNGPGVMITNGAPGTAVAVFCRISAPGAPDVLSDTAMLVVSPMNISLTRTHLGLHLDFPAVNPGYAIIVERATNLPPVGTWERVFTLPYYGGIGFFEPQLTQEFFRVGVIAE
jgi:hypothetical protein